MSIQTNLIRYKSTIPISERLNQWVDERTKDISITEVEEDNYKFTETLKQDPHNLRIYNGNCGNTIFGLSLDNILFRAWHDQVHIQNKLGFSLEEEIEVAFLQAAELPDDWWEERMLIMSEIIGQACYFKITNKFPDNQRTFTKNLLIEGKLYE